MVRNALCDHARLSGHERIAAILAEFPDCSARLRSAEVVRDRAIALPPLNHYLAKKLISRARAAPCLGEFRGSAAVDLAAVEDVLLRVSEMVCELRALRELDINPLPGNEDGGRLHDHPRSGRLDHREYRLGAVEVGEPETQAIFSTSQRTCMAQSSSVGFHASESVAAPSSTRRPPLQTAAID